MFRSRITIRFDRAWVFRVTSMDSMWMMPGRPRAMSRYFFTVCAVGLPSASQLFASVGWYTMRLGAFFFPIAMGRDSHSMLFMLTLSFSRRTRRR